MGTGAFAGRDVRTLAAAGEGAGARVSTGAEGLGAGEVSADGLAWAAVLRALTE
ncbi:hypothetical protein G3I76_60155 [Streptomyces sp. SID11233]|nr:hypothetical protein [Streptomyces sp. SID11233]